MPKLAKNKQRCGEKYLVEENQVGDKTVGRNEEPSTGSLYKPKKATL